MPSRFATQIGVQDRMTMMGSRSAVASEPTQSRSKPCGTNSAPRTALRKQACRYSRPVQMARWRCSHTGGTLVPCSAVRLKWSRYWPIRSSECLPPPMQLPKGCFTSCTGWMPRAEWFRCTWGGLDASAGTAGYQPTLYLSARTQANLPAGATTMLITWATSAPQPCLGMPSR